MAAVVPCLAKELEVQALEVSDIDDVCDSLEIGFSGHSHSHRNLSLFEPDFACPDVDAFDTLDPSLFDSQDEGLAWCPDIMLSPPTSSAASCEQSDGDVAEPNFSLYCTGKLSACASSGTLASTASADSWDFTASCSVLKMERLDSRNSLCTTPSWGSGGGQFKVALNANGLDSELQTDSLYQPSFIPSPGCFNPSTALAAPSPVPQGSKRAAGRSRRGAPTAQITAVDVLAAQQLCLSPLSASLTPDLTLDLKDSLTTDLSLLDPITPSSGLGNDYPDPEPILYSRQRSLSLKQKRNQEPASPRVSGTKRASASTGPVARKLMSHPEGHTCTQCGVKSTPVWRAGPLGPKTLCNACGVRYSKIVRRK